MNFSGLLIFLVSSILLCSLTQSTQEPNFAAADCSGDTYTADSTYRSNLGRLLTELFHGNGFYKTSFGLKPDEIYGLYMCRGDITPEECKACVSTAQGNITQACPNQTTAIIWYDLCMLQYSDNLSILSTVQHSPDKALWNVNSMDSSQFRQNVRSQIYSFYGSYAYAPGLPPPGRSPPLGPPSPGSSYGAYTPARALLGQSSPGPSSGAEQPPTVLLGLGSSSGAEQPLAVLLGPGSSSGTEQPEGSSSGADQPLAPGNGTISSTIIIIITIVLATATIILLSVIYICLRKQKKRRKPKSDTDDFSQISMVQSLQFSFLTIRAATSNFADLNKLGQGGFGPVFKGKFSNGQEIAVKRLSKDSGQGEVEFKNEVMLLAKLQHKNLVQLLGFSLHGKEKLLVYEFLPNTSLDHFIFDPIKRAHLKWKTRLKIIRGIAGGLLYLHEESRLKIIHRDLKASNILLDEKMNPKISDFGMARLCVVDETQNTNKVVGTYGYMAPEYAMHGLFSVKSDVFSFGVLLLEIVSGRKNSSFYQSEHTEDLISFAWKNWTANKLLELIDTILIEDCSMSEMKRCIHIGFLCVQENPADRPTMASVDLMFKSSSITLPVPSPPAFFFQNTRLAEGSSSQTDLWVTEQVPSTSKSTQRSINDESSIELSPGEIHGDGGSPSRKEAVCEITSY